MTAFPPTSRRTSASKRVFFFRFRGQPYGCWTWQKPRAQTSGIVFRVGSLGHVQFQEYRARLVGARADARRGAHGVRMAWWGVSGRRQKKAIDFSIHL